VEERQELGHECLKKRLWKRQRAVLRRAVSLGKVGAWQWG